VRLADALRSRRAPFESAAVNPFLDRDVRFGFEMQIALAGVLL
jgi:hypothetical protein